jgi:hypothetical protein
MLAATFHIRRSATTVAAAVADTTAITITMAGDDITPAQPATAAHGQRVSSRKGGVARGLGCQGRTTR